MRKDLFVLVLLGSSIAPGGSIASAAEPLTYERALALAAERSPVVQAADAAVGVSEGERSQAGVWPNPGLFVEFEEVGGDRAGLDQAEVTVGLSQAFDVGGKRAARVRERDLAIDVTRLSAEAVRWELAAEVRRRFTRALGLQVRVGILAQAHALAVEVERTVGELIRAGEAAAVEQARAGSEAAMTALERDAAGAELRAARRLLVALWNGAEVEAEVLSGDLAQDVPVPRLEFVLERATAGPEAAVRQREIDRLQAALDREKRRRWPDIDVGVGRREYRESGEASYLALVSVPIPVFDRNAGSIRAAEADAARGRADRDAVLARVRSDAAAAHVRLVSAAARIEQLRNVVLPNARSVLEAYAEGYRRGKFRLLELLDARRTVLAAELRLNDELVSFGTTRAELEQVAGPLAEMRQP